MGEAVRRLEGARTGGTPSEWASRTGSERSEGDGDGRIVKEPERNDEVERGRKAQPKRLGAVETLGAQRLKENKDGPRVRRQRGAGFRWMEETNGDSP